AGMDAADLRRRGGWGGRLGGRWLVRAEPRELATAREIAADGYRLLLRGRCARTGFEPRNQYGRAVEDAVAAGSNQRPRWRFHPAPRRRKLRGLDSALEREPQRDLADRDAHDRVLRRGPRNGAGAVPPGCDLGGERRRNSSLGSRPRW